MSLFESVINVLCWNSALIPPWIYVIFRCCNHSTILELCHIFNLLMFTQHFKNYKTCNLWYPVKCAESYIQFLGMSYRYCSLVWRTLSISVLYSSSDVQTTNIWPLMMHQQPCFVIIHHRYNWHYVRAFLNTSSPHSKSWGTCMKKNVSEEDMTGRPKYSLSYIANGETTLHRFKDETNIILSPILALMLFFSVKGNGGCSSSTRYASYICLTQLL